MKYIFIIIFIFIINCSGNKVSNYHGIKSLEAKYEKIEIKKTNKNDLIKIAYLEDAKGKQINNFSSGMKQRLKLALAWLSDTKIVLLDEPCSNLDAHGVDWYKSLARKYSENRLIIVCSNNLNDE